MRDKRERYTRWEECFPARFRSGVATFPARMIKRHAGWTPIVPVWRYTMRATVGLQTTITVSPVKDNGQAMSLELSLEMSLPIPQQDEHLPDQIEAYVHQAGIEVQRRLFQVLIEKADQKNWSCNAVTAKATLASSGVGHDPSHSRRSSARSPFSGRGSATITTARSRYRRRPPGTHPTSSPSPRISGTRSVIR